MKIFSIIWNIICLIFAIFVMVTSENQNKNEDFLMIVMIYSLLWGIILFVRGFYLMLYIPFSIEKAEFRRKEWECAFSFIMAITTFICSIIDLDNGKQTMWRTIVSLLVWFVCRIIIEFRWKKKRNHTQYKTTARVQENENDNNSNDLISDKVKLELLVKRLVWQQIAEDELALMYNETPNEIISKDDREIKVKCFFGNHLLPYEDLQWRKRVAVGDVVAKIALVRNYMSAGFDEFIGCCENIESPRDGVMQANIIGVNGTFKRDNYYHEIKNGQRLLTLYTSTQCIEDFDLDMQKLQQQIKEKEITEAEVREKEKIRQKLLKQKKQRELERKVQQEMIENGELAMEGTKRRHIPHSVVSEVYRRDGARCVICGSMENLQLDHIIPFSKGGADTAENLQILCQKCNLEKSNKI